MLADVSPVRVISFPERLVGWIPLPYWLTYLIFWELLFAADYFIGSGIADGHAHSPESGFLIFFFAMVCITVTYCSRVLGDMFPDLMRFIDHDIEEIRGWYVVQLKRSYEGWQAIAFGILFALLETFTAGTVIRQFTPAGTLLFYFREVYEFLGFFFLGMAVWALINVVRVPIVLTGYKIKVSLNQVSGRGLQALGTSFFKMSLCIVATFIPLVIGVIISPLSDNQFILAWLGSGVLMIFGFFILPQIGVHRIMAREKNQRLLAFTNHLEDAMERSLKEPTAENMQRLKELFDLQTHLRNMNDWPFNTSTLWQLITALLIPVAMAVLEIFFR